MADDWYYAKGDQQLGPVPFGQLQQLAAAGQVGPGEMVWTEGYANWVPAQQVQGLAFAGGGGAAVAVGPAMAGVPMGYYNPLAYAQPGVEYGGFWIRVLAYIIDYLVLLVPNLMFSGAAELMFPETPGQPPDPVAVIARLSVALLNFVLTWLYFAMMESSHRQGTVGKIALGLVVTNMEGERIGFGRATGRYFGKILSALILCVGFMMAGFTERKQALHDMMASTLVVRRRA